MARPGSRRRSPGGGWYAAAAVSEAYLKIRRGEAPARVVPLTGERMVAGRSPEVEIVLESDTVSRQHLELARDGAGQWWVRDLRSRNGTIVNGERVASHRLSYGDIIQVEDYVLTFARSPGEAAPRAGADPNASFSRLTLVDGAVGPVRSLRDLGAPKIDASQLSRLIALSGELLATADEGARLRILCDLMISRDMHGTAALAIRLDRRGVEEPRLLQEPSLAAGVEAPHLSRTVLRAVLGSGAPVVASTSDGGKDTLKLSVMVRAMSAVAVPIGGDETWLDLLYVTLPTNYGTAEWLALVSLAGELFRQAESTWEARAKAEAQAVLEEELERARDIQTRLVPRDFHCGPLDVGFGYEACKWVGGDYVDALPLRDGRVLITVMDVCGKGLEAALIAAGLHTTVHVLVYEGLGLAALVRSLNRYLCETLPAAAFVTMCALVIDPATGSIEQVNCGHPPPIIAAPGGALREIETFDLAPLGFLDVDAEIVVTRDRLDREHTLTLYTDGLSELLDESDRMLGVEGLSEMLATLARECQGAHATQVAGRLRDLLAAYRGGAVPADDASFIIVLRAQPSVTRTGPHRIAPPLRP